MITPCGGYYKIITLFSFDLILNWFIDILTNVSIGCLQVFDRVTVFEMFQSFRNFARYFQLSICTESFRTAGPLLIFIV